MSRPLADLAVAGLDVRLPPSGPASMRLINAATIAGTWTAWVQPMGVGVAAPDDALLAFSVAVDGDDVVLSLADTAAGNPPGLLRDVSGRLVVALGGVPVIAGRCTRTFRARQSTGQVEVIVGGAAVTIDIGGVTIIGSPGGGVSSWDDLTDKPTVFPPDVHTHEPGEVGADPRGMAAAAGAPVGSVVAVAHDFSRTPDGPVHGVLSNGAGTYDPTAWQDGRTVEGESIDVVLEVAHVVDGVLRHRGTRLAAAAVVDLPAGPSHAITLGYVEPTAGPGGGYPAVGMPETGYASTRVSFIEAATSNGYVAYIQQAGDTADHEFVIVRDTATIPDVIAGPWAIGRRLTENDCWSFRHDGSTYSILLNGQTIGRVHDDTWDPATFDSAGIVFSTGSLWLPGVPWWTLALVGQRTAAWADITEKPADFPPATHSHSLGDLTTADTDTTKVVTPNGLGGFKLSAAPSGGGVWQVISDQTLTSNAPAVSFSGLDDWAEIEIRWQGRATPSGSGAVYLNAVLNGDTASNYERSVMYRMSALVSANESDQTAAWVGRIVGSQSNLDRWSNGIIRLVCDQPASARKSVWGEFVCQQSPLAHVAVGQAAGVWANTTDPITTLTLSPAVDEFAAGCRFTLIGRA